jgi:hypothetical protein
MKAIIEPRDSTQFPWRVVVQYNNFKYTGGIYMFLFFARFKKWRLNRQAKHVG